MHSQDSTSSSQEGIDRHPAAATGPHRWQSDESIRIGIQCPQSEFRILLDARAKLGGAAAACEGEATAGAATRDGFVQEDVANAAAQERIDASAGHVEIQ